MLLWERGFPSLRAYGLSLRASTIPVTFFAMSDLLLVPTTAGTGSETTGAAIFDVTSRAFKTGIANRALKPVLGVVDTANTESCPTELHISAGLDVLFHSIESYTAIP